MNLADIYLVTSTLNKIEKELEMTYNTLLNGDGNQYLIKHSNKLIDIMDSCEFEERFSDLTHHSNTIASLSQSLGTPAAGMQAIAALEEAPEIVDEVRRRIKEIYTIFNVM